MTLTAFDGFCGAGGATTGFRKAGVNVVLAANHWSRAIETHSANHPDIDHWQANLSEVDFLRSLPSVDLLWMSPECTKWSRARGKKEPGPRSLFDEVEPLPDEAVIRSRMTMWDVLRAIEALVVRGKPALGGVVENVVDVAGFLFFPQWLACFDAAGYDVEVVSLNSAFAGDADAGIAPVPQLRDRMYVVFWSKSLGRRPDLDIRPPAWCPACSAVVHARQAWKKPFQVHPVGTWGRNGQYWYRCPDCHGIAQPYARPVSDVVDWTDLGTRIGDRKRPLEAATIRRVQAGAVRFGGPTLIPSGGTWNTAPTSVDAPCRTRTTRETEGLACPPGAASPFMLRLRGGGERDRAHPVDGPIGTVSAQGEHHAVVTPPSMVMSYYGNGGCTPTLRPLPTQPTKDRFALVAGVDRPDVSDYTFRMMHPRGEISAAMGFADDYVLRGTREEVTAQLGNAVTTNAPHLIGHRLVGAITGERVA